MSLKALPLSKVVLLPPSTWAASTGRPMNPPWHSDHFEVNGRWGDGGGGRANTPHRSWILHAPPGEPRLSPGRPVVRGSKPSDRRSVHLNSCVDAPCKGE